MIITFYFIISWMMAGLVLFNQNKTSCSIRDTSFLFLLTCLINSHVYLGLFETFKWIETTTDPKHYIAFLFFRSVFSPCFVTYVTLLIFHNPLKKKILFVVLYSGIIIILDKIGVDGHLYSFTKWNLFLTFSYYLLLLFFSILTLKWFRGLKEPEVKKVDDVGGKRI